MSQSSKPRVVALVQARMTSTRLPGKVMLNLAGRPMLQWVFDRLAQCRTLDEVCLATTDQPNEDVLAEYAARRGWPCFRGSLEDVLDRYYHAAAARRADVVVRVTSDCPLIDPATVDAVVAAFLARQPDVDYASNIIPQRTFPRGLDVEVFRRAALETAWREDANPAWREHVTTYIIRHPEQFRFWCLVNETDCSHHRWTVDTPEDFALAERLLNTLGNERFSWRSALELIEANPDWQALNAGIVQKTV